VHEAVQQIGDVFAIFDSRTQDSGHVSYGVEDAEGRQWFVKTSGDESVSAGGATRGDRAQSLLLSAEVSRAIGHPALIPVERVIQADDGVLTLSAWFGGELLHSPRERRADPDEPFRRFQRLPASDIATALDLVIDLHVRLDAVGWTAGDLYDGCLMYEFPTRTIKVIDFEFYHRGSYRNEIGRLPGSTRFMAPEEFTKGAVIDARTTVFTLGRMIEIFLVEQNVEHASREVARAATYNDPDERPASLLEFQRMWRSVARHAN